MHMGTLKELLEGKWWQSGREEGWEAEGREYVTVSHVVCASHAEYKFLHGWHIYIILYTVFMQEYPLTAKYIDTLLVYILWSFSAPGVATILSLTQQLQTTPFTSTATSRSQW